MNVVAGRLRETLLTFALVAILPSVACAAAGAAGSTSYGPPGGWSGVIQVVDDETGEPLPDAVGRAWGTVDRWAVVQNVQRTVAEVHVFADAEGRIRLPRQLRSTSPDFELTVDIWAPRHWPTAVNQGFSSQGNYIAFAARSDIGGRTERRFHGGTPDPLVVRLRKCDRDTQSWYVALSEGVGSIEVWDEDLPTTERDWERIASLVANEVDELITAGGRYPFNVRAQIAEVREQRRRQRRR